MKFRPIETVPIFILQKYCDGKSAIKSPKAIYELEMIWNKMEFLDIAMIIPLYPLF